MNLETLLKESTFVKKIYVLSETSHKGQFRKDGKTPYFTHIGDVTRNALWLVDAFVKGNNLRLKYSLVAVIALCHDLIEDKRCTISTIEDIVREFTDNAEDYKTVISAILLLTKRDNETYEAYILRIKNCDNPYVRIVKIADLLDNLSGTPSEKQVIKYRKAIETLTA